VKGRTAGYASEARFQHAHGRWIWLKIWATATERDAERKARHVVATLMDITGDKKRESELEKRTWQLRALAAQLSSAEERERRQIASELQDNLGQLLGLAEMKLDVLHRSSPDEELGASLQEIAHHLAEASATIRMLSAQAVPPVLRELGLVPALERMAREMEEEHDLRIFVEKEGDLPPLDTDRAVAIFRAARELLTNVAHHARANKARLVISYEPERAKAAITIEDEGVGFDPNEALSKAVDTMHFGLFHIQERFTATGGSFVLESTPGRGTRARLVVPVEAKPSQKVRR
jgi:signal transduction histidine kinase